LLLIIALLTSLIILYFCRSKLAGTERARVTFILEALRRKKKELPVFEAVTITDVAAEGKSIARVNDLVVFVPFVAPGDVVDIRVTKKKNSYAEGLATKFHSYSAIREKPVCEHFGVCGGCKWQHLPYQEQLMAKQKQVLDALVRIGKLTLPEAVPTWTEGAKPEGCFPILGSEKTTFYRNKLEYTFSNKRWISQEELESNEPVPDRDALGFHIPGMFDKVLDISKCWLQVDVSNQIRLAVKAFCLSNGMDFFDLRNQAGLMRNLIIRTASTGELMVIVVFFKEEKAKREALLNYMVEQFPAITSLIYIINEKCNDTIADRDTFVFHGRDHIFEAMENLRFKIGPKSFYQTNSLQAYQLYQVVRRFAGLTGNERVYDLYTGTGTIAQFLAASCRQVIGIEYVPEAIEDARINATLNQLVNTRFFAGDMKDILTPAFISEQGKPDVIVTDPPRAGMHTDVIDSILHALPERIVYVSCNPATQARDLALLAGQYQLTAVQPVDMFPHTHHVENVVLLKRW
jgi:23S rRNA (uracil1939-C5)-methyltransferase